MKNLKLFLIMLTFTGLSNAGFAQTWWYDDVNNIVHINMSESIDGMTFYRVNAGDEFVLPMPETRVVVMNRV